MQAAKHLKELIETLFIEIGEIDQIDGYLTFLSIWHQCVAGGDLKYIRELELCGFQRDHVGTEVLEAKNIVKRAENCKKHLNF